jgi:hypothetical protein
VFRMQRRGGRLGSAGPDACVIALRGARHYARRCGPDDSTDPANGALAGPRGRRWQPPGPARNLPRGANAPLGRDENWHLSGHAAVVLRPMVGAV